MIDPTGTRLAKEFKHARPLIACRFDPAGRYLFAAGEDFRVVRWELETGSAAELAGHESWVRSIGFVGGSVVTADYAGVVRWWPIDADQPRPTRAVEAHDGWVRALALSPDGSTLATCGNDLSVKLWSADDGRPLRGWPGHDSHVYNVVFHPDGERLVTCDLLGIVKEWEVGTGKLLRQLEAKALHWYDPKFRAHIGGARGIDFSTDGKTLALCGIAEVSNAFAGVGEPSVQLFDWESGELAAQLKTKPAFRGTAWGVKIHESGLVYAAGGGTGGAAWWWEPGQTESAHTLKLPQPARDMAAHPDGSRFAVAGSDGVARVYTMTATP